MSLMPDKANRLWEGLWLKLCSVVSNVETWGKKCENSHNTRPKSIQHPHQKFTQYHMTAKYKNTNQPQEHSLKNSPIATGL